MDAESALSRSADGRRALVFAQECREAGIDARPPVLEELEGATAYLVPLETEPDIRWVRLSRGGAVYGADDIVVTYRAEYLVPDLRLATDQPQTEVYSVRQKRLPLLGRVVAVNWLGIDHDLGLIRRLNHDAKVRAAIVAEGDVSLGVSPSPIPRGLYEKQQLCWSVCRDLYQHFRLFVLVAELGVVTRPWRAPSRDAWKGYQRIARHLLETPVATLDK
jgi:hypothetical protein